jgi:hypothetical protein
MPFDARRTSLPREKATSPRDTRRSGLITDSYSRFRLDQGGREPGETHTLRDAGLGGGEPAAETAPAS